MRSWRKLLIKMYGVRAGCWSWHYVL